MIYFREEGEVTLKKTLNLFQNKKNLSLRSEKDCCHFAFSRTAHQLSISVGEQCSYILRALRKCLHCITSHKDSSSLAHKCCHCQVSTREGRALLISSLPASSCAPSSTTGEGLAAHVWVDGSQAVIDLRKPWDTPHGSTYEAEAVRVTPGSSCPLASEPNWVIRDNSSTS